MASMELGVHSAYRPQTYHTYNNRAVAGVLNLQAFLKEYAYY